MNKAQDEFGEVVEDLESVCPSLELGVDSKPITISDVEDDSVVEMVKRVRFDSSVAILNNAIDAFREVAFKSPNGASLTVVEVIGILKSFRDEVKVVGGMEKEKSKIVVP